ncbi:MAG: hypothetical protein U0872_14075 [Planctomycetaceae bacterium]
MKFSPVIALALAVAVQIPTDAAERDVRTPQTQAAGTDNRPLMTTPTTILPRRDDLRNVPAPGGGRLIGYTLNLHPGGRAARMLFSR